MESGKMRQSKLTLCSSCHITYYNNTLCPGSRQRLKVIFFTLTMTNLLDLRVMQGILAVFVSINGYDFTLNGQGRQF